MYTAGYGEDADNTETHDIDLDNESMSHKGRQKNKQIKLLNSFGYIMERMQSAVLRFHYLNKAKDPQAYYYSCILLYRPTCDEEIFLVTQDTYNTNHQQIEEHTKQFNHHVEEIDEAAQHLQQHGALEHLWDSLAPGTQ